MWTTPQNKEDEVEEDEEEDNKTEEEEEQMETLAQSTSGTKKLSMEYNR